VLCPLFPDEIGESAAISYLKSGEQRKVQDGLYGDVSLTSDGHIEVEGAAAAAERVGSGSVWAWECAGDR